MFSNFFKLFIMNSILLISISDNSYALDSASNENSICLNRGYHTPNKLDGNECIAQNSLFASSEDRSNAAMMTFLAFQFNSKKLKPLDDNNHFFSGSKKACLRCSGSTEAELLDAENKLLDRVNNDRKEYGVTLYRDVIINNKISASELSALLKINDSKLTCKEEIESLDTDCQKAFKENLSSSLDFKGIEFKESKKNKIDTRDIFDHLEASSLSTHYGTKRKYGGKMYNGIKSQRASHADSSSGFTMNDKYKKIDSLFESESPASVMFTYEEALSAYKNLQENLVEKMSLASSDDAKDYCDGTSNKLIDDLSKDIESLNDYVSIKNKISKKWICNTLESVGYNPSKIKGESLKKLLGQDRFRIDLKDRIKSNCVSQFKEIEETICKPKTRVDSSIFYNSESVYQDKTFDLLIGESSDDREILAFKAIACIYHEQAKEASGFANRSSSDSVEGRGFNASLRNNIPTSSAKGFLSSRESSGGREISSVRSELGEESEPDKVSDDSKEGIEGDVAKAVTANPFNFYDTPKSEASEEQFNYKPLAPWSPSGPSEAEKTTALDKKEDEEIKKIDKEIELLESKKREIENLKKQLAEVNSSIDDKKMEEASKEKKSLDEQIAALKDQKNKIVEAKARRKNNEKAQDRILNNKTPASGRVASAVNHSTSSQGESIGSNQGSLTNTVTREPSSLPPSSIKNTERQTDLISSRGLEIVYRQKLDDLLSSNQSEKMLNIGVLKLVKDMSNNSIKSKIRIETINGVKKVVFVDQNREIELSQFELKTQKVLIKYVNSFDYSKDFDDSSSSDDKRLDVINIESEEENAENKSFYDAYSGARE